MRAENGEAHQAVQLLAVLAVAAATGLSTPVDAGPVDLPTNFSTVDYTIYDANSGRPFGVLDRTFARQGGFDTPTELRLAEEIRETIAFLKVAVVLYSDPYAHFSIVLENLTDEPMGARFNVVLQTMAIFAPLWQAEGSLDIALEDLDGDGAMLVPTLDAREPVTNTILPGKRFVDGFVNITSGVVSTFGPTVLGGIGPDPVTDAAGGGATMLALEAGPLTFPDYDTFSGIPGRIFPVGVPWNTLRLSVGFELSPHDRVTLSGGVDVVPRTIAGSPQLPAPPALGLFLAALAACRLVRRRPRAV